MTANQTTTTNGQTVSPEKLKKIMYRVERLLAIAEDPGATPAEAETARLQAETYMLQYRIEEAMLDTTEKARMGIRPTSAVWTMSKSNSEFVDQYNRIIGAIIWHVDGFGVTKYNWSEMTVDCEVFGFESDIAYGSLIWNAARIAFQKRLEPTMDPTLDDIENVYKMRCAGMERARIGIIMGWGGEGTKGPGKVTRLFKKGCERHGDDPTVLLGKGNSVKTYRNSYADAFVSELANRLWSLRNQRGLDSDGALVLANRKDQVMELVYEKYPSLRPSDEPVKLDNSKPRKFKAPKIKERPYNHAAAMRGREAARTIDLGPAGKGRLGS